MDVGAENWLQQIKDSFRVNGGGSEDEEPTFLDYFGHFISVPWKVLFALIPPVDFWDGWLTFVISLVMIGVVTTFMGDLAELLGCVAEMPASITAITLVALGTSLPDTFA